MSEVPGPRRRVLRAALAFACALPFAAWSVLAVLLGGGGPEGVTPPRWAFAGALVLALLAAWRRGPRAGTTATALATGLALAWFLALRPSSERDWVADQARLARAAVEGSRVTLRDVRDFRYRSADDWDAAWYDLTVDTSELEGIDFLLTRFEENPAIGHTMVTFRFAGERFVTVSIEVRRERGESYGLLKGLFRQLELAYVVGDERDLVQLRTNARGNDVWLYPCAGSHETQVAYFLDVCRGIERLAGEPAFYDTLTRNCTTVLADHWQRVMDVDLGFDSRLLLPGRVDELAVELGLIESAADSTDAPEYVSERARAAAGSDDFSLRIRR